MVLAVETGHLHVDDREAERAAVLLGVDHALFDGGDEVAGDHTADDRIDELVARTPLSGLDAQRRDRELPVPAALLLQPAFRFRATADRLAVRDMHVVGLDLDTELAGQLLGRDRQVRLAHPAQHGLMRLGIALDAQHRILLLQAMERVGELVLVGLALGVDRDREQRLGRGEHLDVDGSSLGTEHVAGGRVRELGDGRDVARRDLVHRVLLLAPHREELMHALVGLRARVREHRRRVSPFPAAP